MGTSMTVDEARRLYDEAFSRAHCDPRGGDPRDAGLLAVAAEAERRGREAERERIRVEVARRASDADAAGGEGGQEALDDLHDWMTTTTPEPTR